jgi:hypothetical protein
MALLVGGPLSGQDIEMPDDKMVYAVPRPDGRPAPYTRTRINEVEVWGYAPLCYRKVRILYQAMEDG